MRSTREKLSMGTVAIHWLLALSMIAMIAFGLYLEDMPRSPEKGQLMFIHKSFGLVVLALALLRVFWRFIDPFPQHVGNYTAWENILSKIVIVLLVLGTLLMPLSGIAMSLGGGHEVPFFGLFSFGGGGEKNALLSQIGHIGHGLGSKVLIAAIVLHFAGALKHHLIDKDGTIKRMAGHRVEVKDLA